MSRCVWSQRHQAYVLLDDNFVHWYCLADSEPDAIACPHSFDVGVVTDVQGLGSLPYGLFGEFVWRLVLEPFQHAAREVENLGEPCRPSLAQ